MDARKFTHLRRLARIFWAYKTGATRVPQLPVRLWIESTSHCNLRCGYCPNKDIEKADDAESRDACKNALQSARRLRDAASQR